MADFKYCSSFVNNYSEYAPYIVTGKITEEDVEMINNASNKKLLIMQNTANQDSKIISKISKDKALFSILDGIDYLKITKYRMPHYIKRTINSPLVLSKIIEFFEQIESKIRPSWDDTEKCLYVYKTIAEHFHYQYDDEPENEMIDGNNYKVVKSLSGLLYNRLVCVGFSIVFKEAMDRLGIPCYYQNYQNHHSWNIVKLDGKYRAVDLTWESCNKQKGHCGFIYFGRDSKFYENKHHNLENEPEETKFNLTPFTDEELIPHIKNIKNEISKTFSLKTFENEKGETIKYYNVKEDKYTKYYIDLFGKLVVVYLSDEIMPSRGLTISSIVSALNNDGYIGPKPENKPAEFNFFQRRDGTTFLISKTQAVQKNAHEFCYLDIINENGVDKIRRSYILSENNLFNITDEKIKLYIANKLLTQERLNRKLESFNGYVGYLGSNYQMYYSKSFEESLNISNHRR